MKYGWILLMIVAALQALVGAFQLIVDEKEVFEKDTGVAWTELSETYPTVANQFSMASRAAIVATFAIGLLSMTVIYFAFRKGQTWSWFAMWILPANMIPGVISLARTENQAGIAVMGGAFILVAVAGLLLSYRIFFPR